MGYQDQDYQKQYQRARYLRLTADKKAYIAKYLEKHPCVDCGEPDRIVLEFDHVRGEKRRDVSQMIYSKFSIKDIADEIAKCEVRCANCHRRVTWQRRQAA